MAVVRKAAEFTAALKQLGWTHDRAAAELGVSSRQLVTSWASGKRKIPKYIGAHMETHLRLERLLRALEGTPIR